MSELAILRPRRGILIRHTRHWHEAIRDPGDIGSTAPVTDQDRTLVEALMDQLVDAKITGGELAERPEPAPASDLTSALEASIRQRRDR